MELDKRKDWEEFSSCRNSMDFNDGSCEWRSSSFPWEVNGSDYKILEININSKLISY